MAERVRIDERQDLSIASLLARRGMDAAAIGTAIAIDLPTGPTFIAARSDVAIGTGPGTWLVCRRDAEPGWTGELERRLAGLASVSDQTGAYRVFGVEGHAARTLLQRGISIDLDDAAFPARAVAVTMIGHIDVIVRRLEDGPSYEVAVYRSCAGSFLRWVDAAMAGL